LIRNSFNFKAKKISYLLTRQVNGRWESEKQRLFILELNIIMVFGNIRGQNDFFVTEWC